MPALPTRPRLALAAMATCAVLAAWPQASSAAPLAALAPLGTLDGEQADAATSALTQSFAPALSGTLERIVWWGFHGSNSLGAAFDDFAVSLGGPILTGGLSVSTDGAGLSRYALDIVDLPLTAGAPGVLSIVNNGLDVEWFWQTADASTRSLAFSLDGTAAVGVPEPSAALLTLLALAGAAAASVRARAARPRQHAAAADLAG